VAVPIVASWHYSVVVTHTMAVRVNHTFFRVVTVTMISMTEGLLITMTISLDRITVRINCTAIRRYCIEGNKHHIRRNPSN